MLVCVKQSIVDEMCEYGKHCLPFEACGILLGSSTRRYIHIQRFVPLRNVSGNPKRHFAINTLDLLPFLQDETNIAGIFHTHPTAPPIPSAEDTATEWHTAPTHWIASYANPGLPQIRCFRYVKTAGGVAFKPLLLCKLKQ